MISEGASSLLCQALTQISGTLRSSQVSLWHWGQQHDPQMPSPFRVKLTGWRPLFGNLSIQKCFHVATLPYVR